VGIHTILLYPHHLCSSVSARIAVSNECLSPSQESRRFDQRYKNEHNSQQERPLPSTAFQDLRNCIQQKKTLSSEDQIKSLSNMKITALLALALAAVVAASPVAEPELVERKQPQFQSRLPRRLLYL
jgi:hypothetical protein